MKAELKRLENLKARRCALETQIQKLESLHKSKERKRETRRKILVGAYYLNFARENQQWDELREKLDAFLKRDSDRQLFDLVTSTSGSNEGEYKASATIKNTSD